jgi:hypothetical protein
MPGVSARLHEEVSSMVGKTKRPTKEERERLKVSKENIPCLCCLIDTARTRLPTIQHVTSGGRRLGHMHTYSSCEWHHLGIPPDVGGPSFADGRKPFERHYGKEDDLVLLQDFLYGQYQNMPWLEYNIPTSTLYSMLMMHRDMLEDPNEAYDRPRYSTHGFATRH